jgi:hypothetical protein
MNDFTYNDIRNYVLKEMKGRDAGTYTSLGGVAMAKMEDTPAGALVTFRYNAMSWQFTYTHAELGRKEPVYA